MNNKNFNVIKISGIKGLLIVGFLICCFASGFVIFPGWICMHCWNFVSNFVTDMPTMTLLHGSILWLIIALSIYALNKGNFAVSIGTSMPFPMRTPKDERIKEILKKISEKNAEITRIDETNQIDDLDKIISDVNDEFLPAESEENEENKENSDDIVHK